MKQLLLCGLFITLGSSVQAQESIGERYQCKGPDTRQIFVRYFNSPAKVPCEVVYEKPQETKSLWNARHEVGYCEAKAAAFVVKHQGWGYTCQKISE